MRERIVLALAATGLFGWATGCKKQVDRTEVKSAINQSFAGRHICLWPESIKLPVQADPSKDERIRDYDALTDAGLFVREEPDEKKRFLAGSKQVVKYNLSDKGHPAWTADPNQPDHGNFCFGHFNVTAIEKAIPNDAANPTQYAVTYHYEVEGIPEWVRTPESMRAFPKIAADTSIESATATLVKNAEGGWEVAPPQPAQ
jgi:hypothetical protein